MNPRSGTRLVGGLIVALLSAPPLVGQDAPVAAAPAWTGSASANWYVLPDDEDFLNPIVTAGHGRLHLEARYNYEDLHTTSVFAGWVFEVGQTVEFVATPMFGVLAGHTDGVAPGANFSLSWRDFWAYSEIEYVIDSSDHQQNYYYSWSELTYAPFDWLSAGVVAQRTRAFQTDAELEPGVLLAFGWRRYSATGYWFTPGADDTYGILNLGMEF